MKIFNLFKKIKTEDKPKSKPDKICEKCNLVMRLDRVLYSYPAIHVYECDECGNVEKWEQPNALTGEKNENRI